MKKNITINMFGMLFNIDEDAYQLLENYLHNMKDYFSRREGGEEIADDIERRVAEILSEQKQAGEEAVTIEHIRDIMHRIGNPQEMDDEESKAGSDSQLPPPPPASQQQERTRRKFYRDNRDKMLGGVLSGMCKFFGGTSVLPWRLIFLLLCFVSFWGAAVVYIIIWALTPEARTAEERLLMQGIPITQENLNNEIMNGTQADGNLNADQNNLGQRGGCMNQMLAFVVGCMKILTVLMLLSIFIGALVFLVTVIIGMVCIAIGAPIYFYEGSPFGNGLELTSSLGWWSISFAICILTLVFIPLYALVRGFTRKDSDSSSSRSGWKILATWVGVLVATIVTTMGTGFTMGKVLKNIKVENDKEYVKENTRNGMFLSSDSWEFLEESGWKIVDMENANTHITDLCDSMEGIIEEYPSEEESFINYLTLRQEGKSEPMRYKAEKKIDVVPGRYRIAGLVYTDGQGNALYAQQGNKILASLDIKGYYATDTLLSHKICEFIFRRPATPSMDSVLTSKKWMPVEMEITVPENGELYYGFTNDKKIKRNPWTATCMNVYYLCIERMEDIKNTHGKQK